MNGRTLGWALAFGLAGLVAAAGWFPGAGTAAVGPRIGLAVALLTFSLVLAVGSFAGALRARSERATGTGACPVGAKCACGHFNFKPRLTCRDCGAPTRYTA